MSKTNALTAILAGAGAVLVAVANAGAPAETPDQVVTHHMGAFATHDLDAIVSDYADNAVMIHPDQTFVGKAAIRKFFASMASPDAPKLASQLLPGEGAVVSASWTLGAGTKGELQGKDVFVIHNGKIQTQAVYIQAPAPK